MSDNYKIDEPEEATSFGNSGAKVTESEENCFVSVLKNKTNSQTSIVNQYWALRYLARSKGFASLSRRDLCFDYAICKSFLKELVNQKYSKEIIDNYCLKEYNYLLRTSNTMKDSIYDDQEIKDSIVKDSKKSIDLINKIKNNPSETLIKEIDSRFCQNIINDMYNKGSLSKKRFNEFVKENIKLYEEKYKKTYFYSKFEKFSKEFDFSEKTKEVIMFTSISNLRNFGRDDVDFYKQEIDNLREIGFIKSRNDNFYLTDLPNTSLFYEPIYRPISEKILKAKNLKKELDLSDYQEDTQNKIKTLIDLIVNHDGKRPLNILLYGYQGSGKTSLVSYLNSIIDKKFIFIEKDIQKNKYLNNGETPSESSDFSYMRMNYLNLCNKVAKNNNYVFVIDECDDTLNSPFGSKEKFLAGKREVNNLLETIYNPTIWISNYTDGIDSSSIRRFQYSIKFNELNFDQRMKVWKTQLKKTKTENLFTDEEIKTLCMKYNLNPGIISSCLQNIKSLNQKENNYKKLEEFLINFAELSGEKTGKDNKKAENENYSLEGLNIESMIKLEDIDSALKRFSIQLKNGTNKTRSYNLLLEGVPGTGKTEYAKHIARTLDMPLIYTVGSDYLSMWVGETERIIRQTFERAESTKSIIFIDEADGLIHQRANARASWEVTQVNEFLSQMERFNGILICATNFISNMDDASIRRFNLKVRFKELDKKGKQIFFDKMLLPLCSDKPDYERLDYINNLTPGDFKVVRDKYSFIYGDKVEFDALYDGLKKEVAFKAKKTISGFSK